MSKKRLKYFADSEGLFTHGAIIFMSLAAVFTLLGSLGQTGDRYFMLTGLALPLGCELLFIAAVAFLGRHTMLPTAFPMVFFAVYFIIRAFTFENVVYMVIFIVLYLAVAVLFTATVFGWIRNKWLLAAFIFLAIALNVALIDYPALSKVTVTVTFCALMQEIAVLFILMGLLFSALSLKNKRNLEDTELPKMRSHRVVKKNVTSEPDNGAKTEELNAAAPTEAIAEQGKKDAVTASAQEKEAENKETPDDSE